MRKFFHTIQFVPSSFLYQHPSLPPELTLTHLQNRSFAFQESPPHSTSSSMVLIIYCPPQGSIAVPHTLEGRGIALSSPQGTSWHLSHFLSIPA